MSVSVPLLVEMMQVLIKLYGSRMVTQDFYNVMVTNIGIVENMYRELPVDTHAIQNDMIPVEVTPEEKEPPSS